MTHEDKQLINLLKTSKGQIDGILKMIENDRYCVDISKQILAVQSMLKKANLRILEGHINSCVKEAFSEGKGDEKVSEVIDILGKYIK
ncbi:metal-sensing transcriptional repressor [Haloplasma contractile]|uniref:Copper-sensing transcriptional repressor CsoR n=1 Tax=Haloplasma contractile SSD-17B TaxID=1033810 RepID=U2FGP7_9MOLU|nr:metal-sensing transcriptional repressor [Haloplasma contractile]ERJ12020.1 Copper-sensing transcriptional repressor CsoR protein [Haloplasma contractile SSD-17B]